MAVEIIRHTNLSQCSELQHALLDIVRPYYLDPTAVLERELRHCNVAYLHRDTHGSIAAFALFAYEELFVPGEDYVPTLYAGLCAASLTLQKRGMVFKLWSYASEEAIRWEKEHGKALLAWATTATPVTYYGASMYHHLEPRLDGSFSPTSIRYARALKAKHALGADHDHPFVLKRYANSTRYSPFERSAIQQFCASKQFRIFDLLGIDESQGDRLLMIGRFKQQFSASVFRHKQGDL